MAAAQVLSQLIDLLACEPDAAEYLREPVRKRCVAEHRANQCTGISSASFDALRNIAPSLAAFQVDGRFLGDRTVLIDSATAAREKHTVSMRVGGLFVPSLLALRLRPATAGGWTKDWRSPHRTRQQRMTVQVMGSVSAKRRSGALALLLSRNWKPMAR